MDADRRDKLDATKAELKQCQQELEDAHNELQFKSECVDVLNAYVADLERQLKPQLAEAEMATSQLPDQVATNLTEAEPQLTQKTMTTQRLEEQVVAMESELKTTKAKATALTTNLTEVQSQLTRKTMAAQHLEEQVVAMESELKTAKADATAKDLAMSDLQDQVAALKTALHEKCRAKGSLAWMWLCLVSLLVVGVVHAWRLAVVIMSWMCWLVMSVCWTVKTWATTELAKQHTADQGMRSERPLVGRKKVGLWLLVVLVLFGVATLATHNVTMAHHSHNLTSRPLPWMDVTGLVGNKTLMVVDGVSVPLFADTIAFSPVGDSPSEADPVHVEGDANDELVSRFGSMVATAFRVATTTAGRVVTVWVGWGIVWSLVQVYCRSP